MRPVGEFRHVVTLETPGDPVPDPEGGFTQTWTDLAGRVRASIQPATVRDLERIVGPTVQTQASHLVVLPYVAGVTTQTRVTFHDGDTDRRFSVTGVYDEDERHRQLVLACTEAH